MTASFAAGTVPDGVPGVGAHNAAQEKEHGSTSTDAQAKKSPLDWQCFQDDVVLRRKNVQVIHK